MFQKEGLEPQQRILGNFTGLYRTEFGDVNQIIMMFGYADAGEHQSAAPRCTRIPPSPPIW